MRLVAFNDAHIRGSTPRSRIDDYPEAIWSKFQQLTTFISTHKIAAVLNGGDLFDTPDPSTGVVNRYLKLFKSWDIPIYSVIGSHDKFGYNDKTVARTALGTLWAAGVCSIVSGCKQIGETCSIAGVSHSYSLDENPKTDYFRKKTTEDGDYFIQICHGMITEGPFFGKYTVYSQIQTEADLVICGHYHPGFGPYEVSGSTIINIGAMGRTENIVRAYPPGFLYIDTAIPSWDFIPFDTEKNPFVTKTAIDSTTLVDIEKFIEMLRQKVGDFEKTDIKELIISIGKESKIPLKTIKRALEYVEDSEKNGSQIN